MEKKRGQISAEELKAYMQWAKETVKTWHDKVNPKYVFLSGENAVKLSLVLKETWKSAYTQEKQPRFLSDIRNKINDKEAKVIIYEEALAARKRKDLSPVSILRQVIKNGRKTSEALAGDKLIEKSNAGNIWIEQSSPEAYLKDIGVYSFAVNDSLNSTDKLGDMGREAGRELKQKTEFILKTENKTLGLLTLLSFFEGSFFLSSNMTGHAVSNLTRTSSSGIGAVLLLAGLAGCYFLVRKNS